MKRFKQILIVFILLNSTSLIANSITKNIENLKKGQCSGCDLRNANLTRLSFSLSGVDLSNANLSGVDLKHLDLSGSDLSNANLARADLYGTNLSNANLENVNFDGARLARANLKEANLSKAKLNNANLRDANLTGATFCRTLTPSGIDNSGCYYVNDNSKIKIDDQLMIIRTISAEPYSEDQQVKLKAAEYSLEGIKKLEIINYADTNVTTSDKINCNISEDDLTYFMLQQCEESKKPKTYSSNTQVENKSTQSYSNNTQVENKSTQVSSNRFSKYDSELEMTCIFEPNALSPSGSHTVFQKKGNYVHHEGKKDLIIETDTSTNKKFIIKNDGIYKIFGFYGMIDFVKKRLYLNESDTTKYQNCY
jgi:uncharacterized protein YjbI with pentapeptide repeats